MTVDGRVVAGRYRLGRRIGSGAMGIVWQAHDELLYRTVAVKQLLLQSSQTDAEADEAKRRAMREGRIAARLQHPNAVAVFDVVDEGDGMPWLVMEYVPSKSLAAVLDEQGTLPPQEAARIGMHVASALAAAHAAGIVHRDVKPGNVLLGEDGTVKITDFGISRAQGDSTVTATGMLAGTPAYLAPEIAKGHDPSPSSDVFSLGATIYAVVEGAPPFGLSDNPLALLHKVASGQVNPPRQAGPLTAALMALLSAEPTERVSMVRVREAMGAIAAGQQAPNLAMQAVAQQAPVARAAVPGTRVDNRPVATPPRGTATSAMPPVRPRTRPEPEPSKLNKGAAVGIGLAVVAAAAVGILVVTILSNKGNANDGGNQAGQGGGTSASQGPTPSTSVPTSRAPITADPTGQQETQLVQDYYNLAPSNPTAAWALLSPTYETKHPGGQAAWKANWDNVKSVSLSNLRQTDAYVVQADAHVEKKDGTKVKQAMLFSIKWTGTAILIDNETVIGAPQPES